VSIIQGKKKKSLFWFSWSKKIPEKMKEKIVKRVRRNNRKKKTKKREEEKEREEKENKQIR